MNVKCVNLTQFLMLKCKNGSASRNLFSASQPEEKQYQEYDQGHEKDNVFGFF
jgi:hypothetical protein